MPKISQFILIVLPKISFFQNYARELAYAQTRNRQIFLYPFTIVFFHFSVL